MTQDAQAVTEVPASTIRRPPAKWGIILLVGPSLIWCAEYVGSGEVILATRAGAILGTSVLWAVVAGIVLKFWIGMSGARYTVCTGEGMIDMFARIPGPSNWAVWIVLVAQLAAAAVSIASIAAAAGAFLNSLFDLPPFVGGWLVTFFSLAVVWSGTINILKVVMSVFVLITVVGVCYVAFHVLPRIETILAGFVPGEPIVPDWARGSGVHDNSWSEVLPLLGWGAGGFASQVWYTYWVLGAGYGWIAAHAAASHLGSGGALLGDAQAIQCGNRPHSASPLDIRSRIGACLPGFWLLLHLSDAIRMVREGKGKGKGETASGVFSLAFLPLPLPLPLSLLPP